MEKRLEFTKNQIIDMLIQKGYKFKKSANSSRYGKAFKITDSSFQLTILNMLIVTFKNHNRTTFHDVMISHNKDIQFGIFSLSAK